MNFYKPSRIAPTLYVESGGVRGLDLVSAEPVEVTPPLAPFLAANKAAADRARGYTITPDGAQLDL